MNAMKKSALAAAAAAMLGFAASASADVVVDLFADPTGGQSVSTSTLGATDNNQVGPFPTTSIVGGYRDISITKTADNNGSVDVGNASLVVDTGTLVQSNDLGVKSKGVITWDGSNNAGAGGLTPNTVGLGGVDFTAGGGATEFLAQVLQADLGFDYKIQVWDMDGHSSTLSAGVQFPVTSPSTAHYLFDWFNLGNGNYCDGVATAPVDPLAFQCADPSTQLGFRIDRSGLGGDIDFSSIGALQLTLENASTYSVDLALGSIRSIPEPSALALVGLALLGAGVARRSRRSVES